MEKDSLVRSRTIGSVREKKKRKGKGRKGRKSHLILFPPFGSREKKFVDFSSLKVCAFPEEGEKDGSGGREEAAEVDGPQHQRSTQIAFFSSLPASFLTCSKEYFHAEKRRDPQYQQINEGFFFLLGEKKVLQDSTKDPSSIYL